MITNTKNKQTHSVKLLTVEDGPNVVPSAPWTYQVYVPSLRLLGSANDVVLRLEEVE